MADDPITITGIRTRGETSDVSFRGPNIERGDFLHVGEKGEVHQDNIFKVRGNGPTFNDLGKLKAMTAAIILACDEGSAVPVSLNSTMVQIYHPEVIPKEVEVAQSESVKLGVSAEVREKDNAISQEFFGPKVTAMNSTGNSIREKGVQAVCKAAKDFHGP